MEQTPKRKVQSGEEFWGGKEALLAAYDRGEDPVAKAVALANTPEEAVVES